MQKSRNNKITEMRKYKHETIAIFFSLHGQIIINVVLHSARTSQQQQLSIKISIKRMRKKKFPRKKIN